MPCVDWYGSVRPLSRKNRVFALFGYEIVEGNPIVRGIAVVGEQQRAQKAQEGPWV